MRTKFNLLPVLMVLPVVSCARLPEGGNPSRLTIEDPPAVTSTNDTTNARAFVLGVGDVLAVSVWRNADLARTVSVDPTGNIDFPLAGTVPAAGSTLAELKDELTRRLSEKYLVNPQVTINTTELRGRKVFVFGEVSSPGVFDFDPRMSLIEAVSSAGGFTADANRQRVLLVRRTAESSRVTAVDVRSMLGADGKVQDALLRDRDLIYIPPSRIANVERFMVRFSHIISPIVGVESAIVLGRDAIDALTGEGGSKNVVVTN